MGSSGLEPPTSRLSGVRSNQLSYEPILLRVLPCHKSLCGGGKRIRTDDPLLAKQVLYQLSYTPVVSPLLPFQGAFRYLENYIASSNKLRKLPSRHAT